MKRFATRVNGVVSRCFSSSSSHDGGSIAKRGMSPVSMRGVTPPSLTMFIRKDHYLFTGTDGTRRMNALIESYAHARTSRGETRVTFPYFLPHNIQLHDFNMCYGQSCYGQSFISGDLHSHSCFALFFDDKSGICGDQGASVSTVSGALRPANGGASYYRCFVDTHIVNASPFAVHNKEVAAYVKGHDGTVIPARTVLDDMFITTGHTYGKSCGELFAVPFTFDVSAATDAELGIDEEWERIKRWARNKM